MAGAEGREATDEPRQGPKPSVGQDGRSGGSEGSRPDDTGEDYGAPSPAPPWMAEKSCGGMDADDR
jgi:hypothetical protein